jgi:hypothetical protein
MRILLSGKRKNRNRFKKEISKMSKFMLILSVFMALENPLFASANKPFEFVDVVYKIESEKDHAFISFHRHPSIYEFEKDAGKKYDQMNKLENSKKNKKPVKVLVDPKTRKILEVFLLKK